jgi:drug/metabolite transporter (DMT)-like permease
MAGAALLFTPDAGASGVSRGLIVGFLVLQVGMAGWSFGSIVQRRKAGKAHPIVAGGVQQLAAGLAMIPLVLVSGDWTVHFSTRGVSAILYLVVFGSLVGYSAYVYVMDKLPVAIVSVYPYVNAVVAVFLGWLFYREPFGWRETAAMVVIFSGVAVVKRYGHKPTDKSPTAPLAKPQCSDSA